MKIAYKFEQSEFIVKQHGHVLNTEMNALISFEDHPSKCITIYWIRTWF